MLRRQHTSALLLFIIVVVVACSLPTAGKQPDGAPVSQVPPALLTSAAQTVVAAQTQAAPTNIPPEVLTASANTAVAALTQNAPLPPSPTATATPSPQPSPSLTPTITPTPTPSTPMISVSVNTNCRTGPGDAYDRVGALVVGETAEVLARDPSGLFWYIPNPDRPGGKCWVWGQYATITGDTASLPVLTPPPTPTPAPAFVIKGLRAFSTLAYVQCRSGYAFYIEISNTGEVPWRSYRVEATDLNTSATNADAGNRFASANSGCLASLDMDTLTPGNGGYIFYYHRDDGTHRFHFKVTLYTGDNQTGQYLTHTIDYTP